MSVLYVVSLADAQSIPFELGVRLRCEMPDLMLATFYARSEFPAMSDRDVLLISTDTSFSLKGALRLFRLVLKQRPKVIHTHHGVSALIASYAGKLVGARLVKTEHNDHRFRSKSEKITNALTLPLLDAVVCNSRATLESFSSLEQRLTGRRKHVIYNGVDIEFLRSCAAHRQLTRSSIGVTKDTALIGTACRFVPQKNLGRLVEAFSILRSSMPGVHLALAGTGPLRSQLEAQVRDLALEDVVSFTGPLDRASVYAFMNALDVFAVPSLWEGFCNAAVEAMVVGAPVVASDIVTLREVLHSHAIYVDPLSPPSIADGLGRAISEDASTREARTSQAQAFAQTRYSLETTAEAYRQLYSTLKGQAA